VLVDSSVARSFAVVGWTLRLVAVAGGRLLLAEGVHGATAAEPSELRNIRSALARQAQEAGLGSGLSSRALAAVHGLDELLELQRPQLTVLPLDEAELNLAIRLQSRDLADREWRHSLGARSRRLDAGEAASIAIASNRSLAFASDDEDALVLWYALTSTQGLRTRDLLHRSVKAGVCEAGDARAVYYLLQSDDLHNLGGPPWQ
jgi:hypothetical protein